MNYLVISDVHGNLEALEATLEAADRQGYDRVLMLGDLVGYGADPDAVIDRIRGLNPLAIVRGNHDKVAAGLDDAEGFNQVARAAALWTSQALRPNNREYLVNLPVGPLLVDELVEICHGAPFDEDAYIFDELEALRAVEGAERALCLFGHTHQPMVFLHSTHLDAIDPAGAAEFRLPLRPGIKYLVNPGSVGQPRDGDARAGYAIVDAARKELRLYRVEYAVAIAQAKVLKAGLPGILAQRLAIGR